jgi:hypothetical protein
VLVLGQAAHYFIGGYLQETAHAVFAGAVQQHLSAEHIGANELVGRKNTAVDVGLGGEIHDCINAGQSCQHGGFISDIAFDKAMSGRVQTFKIIEVSGVGQRVKIYQFAGRPALERQPDKGRTNETRASGNKQLAHFDRSRSGCGPGTVSHLSTPGHTQSTLLSRL